MSTNRPNIGVYAGSFDPVTRGHMDIIFQGARLMSTLYVVVGVNPDKHPLFTDDERVAIMRHEVEHVVKPKLAKAGIKCDIRVEKSSGLTTAFMQAHDAPFFIRGLRLGMEFDAEYPRLVAGRNEYKEFTPIFLCTADPQLQIISSSLAREVARFDGNIKKYVTPYVARKLTQRIEEKKLRLG